MLILLLVASVYFACFKVLLFFLFCFVLFFWKQSFTLLLKLVLPELTVINPPATASLVLGARESSLIIVSFHAI